MGWCESGTTEGWFEMRGLLLTSIRMGGIHHVNGASIGWRAKGPAVGDLFWSYGFWV